MEERRKGEFQRPTLNAQWKSSDGFEPPLKEVGRSEPDWWWKQPLLEAAHRALLSAFFFLLSSFC